MKSSNLEIKFVIVYKFVEGLNTYGHFFFLIYPGRGSNSGFGLSLQPAIVYIILTIKHRRRPCTIISSFKGT